MEAATASCCARSRPVTRHQHCGARGDADAPRPPSRRAEAHHARRGQGVRRGRVHRELWQRTVPPHIDVNGALNKLGRVRRNVLDGRTLRHAGYAAGQRHRKRIAEVFGWSKPQAGFANAGIGGLANVIPAFIMMAAACNLRRLAGLAATSAEKGVSGAPQPAATALHTRLRRAAGREHRRRAFRRLLQQPNLVRSDQRNCDSATDLPSVFAQWISVLSLASWEPDRQQIAERHAFGQSR